MDAAVFCFSISFAIGLHRSVEPPLQSDDVSNHNSPKIFFEQLTKIILLLCCLQNGKQAKDKVLESK